MVRTARPRSAAARGARRRARFFFTAGLGFAETGYGSAQGTRSAHFIAAATSTGGSAVGLRMAWPPPGAQGQTGKNRQSSDGLSGFSGATSLGLTGVGAVSLAASAHLAAWVFPRRFARIQNDLRGWPA